MRIAICDDEPIQLDLLERSIKGCSIDGWRPVNISRYSSGQTLLQDIADGRDFEYVFLDIHMPEMSGLQTYESLVELSEAQTIFVSTHAEALPEVFALRTPYFLYKPYTQDTFDRTVRIVLERQSPDYLFTFQTGGVSMVLPCSRICFFRSDDHYLQVVADEMTYMSRGKLDDVEKELEPYHFFRCHRGYLINLRYYKKRTAHNVLLKGSTELIRIPLSKARVSALNRTYLKYKTGGQDAF